MEPSPPMPMPMPTARGGALPLPSSSPQHAPPPLWSPKRSPRHAKLQRVTLPPATSRSGVTYAPAYTTASVAHRDPLHGQFRHELCRFHQQLQDAVAASGATPLPAHAQAQAQASRSGTNPPPPTTDAVLAVLTSDRSAAVLTQFFQQWTRVHASASAFASGLAPSSAVPMDEQELLSAVLDTLFGNLPLVLSDTELRDPTRALRYVDALRALRGLLHALLFTPATPSSSSSATSSSSSTPFRPVVLDADRTSHATAAVFASSAALLAATGAPSSPPPQRPLCQVPPPPLPPSTTMATATRGAAVRRVPLFLRCQQLEIELAASHRRQRALRLHGQAPRSEAAIGVLSATAMDALLLFWELPESERVALLSQIASQSAPDEALTTARVFLSRCATLPLARLGYELQYAPHVQHALANKRRRGVHGKDLGGGNENAEDDEGASGSNSGSGNSSEGSSSMEDDDDGDPEEDGQHQANDGKDGKSETSRRRSSRRSATVGRRRTRASRVIDLSALTGAFENVEEDEEDEEDGEDGEDQTGGETGRRSRRLRILERGRTPPHRRRHHHRHRSHRHRQQQQFLHSASQRRSSHGRRRHWGRRNGRELGAIEDEDDIKEEEEADDDDDDVDDVDDEDEDDAELEERFYRRARRTTTGASEQVLLRRLHFDLLELLKHDDQHLHASAATGVLDAAWALVAAIDASQGRQGGSISAPKRLASFHAVSVADNVAVAPSVAVGKSAAGSSSVPSPRGDARSSHLLTEEQQFLIKMDQLHSALVTLGAYSLSTMSSDTISAAYKRMMGLHKLFAAFSARAYEAVGLDPTPPVPRNRSSNSNSNSKANPPSNQRGVTLSPLPLLPQPSHAEPVTTATGAEGVGTGEHAVAHTMGPVLHQLGLLVRNLAPLVPIHGPAPSQDRSASAPSSALSSDVLHLADDLEGVVAVCSAFAVASSSSSSSSSALSASSPSLASAATALPLRPPQSMAMALAALTQSQRIERVIGLVAAAGDQWAALQTLAAQQQQQLDALASNTGGGGTGSTRYLLDEADMDLVSGRRDHHAHRKASARPNGNSHEVVDDDVEDDDDATTNVDESEVLRMATKARARRASARQATAENNRAMATTATSGGGDRDPTVSTIAGDEVRANDDNDDTGNRTTMPRFLNRDIPLAIKQAGQARQGAARKLLNVGLLLRVVDQLYRECYEAMTASLQYGSRRMEFSEFLYDWHIRKYGLKTLAQQHLLKLIQSLRRHERKVFQCQLCLRFLGIQNALGFHEHKFVLTLLDKWSGGTFWGATKHRVEHAPRQFKLRVVVALATLHETLTERFGGYYRSAEAVAAKVRALALPSDDEFIRESDLLRVALDEWLTLRGRLEQLLEAVFTAGDVNGDGSLELDEFTAVLRHIAPTVDDRTAHQLFTSAHDELHPRRISRARFVDLVLLERVLAPASSSSSSSASSSGLGMASAGSSTVAASSLTAPAGAGLGGAVPSSSASKSTAGGGGGGRGADKPAALLSEEEELHQFALLDATWATDSAVVLRVLARIPHAPTVASLQFRVSFLTQIIAKRVDAATAWLCHKQIMRAVNRYQHLDADELVGLQKKEQRGFQAAVRAVQRLRCVLLRPVLAKEEEGGGEEEEEEEEEEGKQKEEGGERNEDGAMGAHASYVSAVDERASTNATPAELEELVQQLRQQFVEQADEASIEDFKVAVQRLRRVSHAMGDGDPAILAAVASHSVEALREDEEGEEEEEEEDDVDDNDDDDEGGGDDEEEARRAEAQETPPAES